MLFLFFALALVVSGKHETVVRSRDCGKRIIGYHQSWGDHLLSELQTKYLTHVIFAFMETTGDGTIRVGSVGVEGERDLTNDTNVAKAKLANLVQLRTAPGADFKTLFAVGGWENSQYFSGIAADSAKTDRFIQSSIELIKQYRFDGIDIDWEYPVKGGAVDGMEADKENYVIFLKKIRAALSALSNQLGRMEPYLLTIAGAAGKWTLDSGYDLPGLLQDDGPLDWINVMTYDYYGAWESQWGAYTGPPSPLRYHAPKRYAGNMNAHWTMKYYTCRSERPDKIVMGVPFYGRYWLNVGPPVDGDVSGHWRKAEAVGGRFLGGFASWDEIIGMWANIDNMEHQYDCHVGAPWAYDASRRLFLGYEDPRSVAEKVLYAKNSNLGGLMFWSLDLDDDSISMLRALTAQDLCNLCSSEKITYKCSPIKEQRWWTWAESKELGGMCGRSAPIYKGFYPICDPEDPAYSCCGSHGWCGSGTEFCSCDDCVDYAENPHVALSDPKPKYPLKYYTMDAPEGKRGRCGYEVPKINGSVYAGCNADDPLRKCCSNGGYCGKGEEFCECEGCVDFSAESSDFTFPEKQWFVWPDPNAGRCGLDAPKLNGKTAICNPRSSDYHCCSPGGYCGSGPDFCECASCVDFKTNPDYKFAPRKWFVWPHPDAGKCGPNSPRINGEIAECDPGSSEFHCCSASGYCGTGEEFCGCDECQDYASSNRQRRSLDIFRKTTGAAMRLFGSAEFSCAPDAKPITELNQLEQDIVGNHIRVFEDHNFGGDFVDVSAYAERMPHGWNDRIDSVKCLSTMGFCTIVLFYHEHFSGISMMFDKEASTLGELHDQVSSLMAFPAEMATLCVWVFEDTNFHGDPRRFCGDEYQLGNWDKKISSVKMDCSDCSVVLFDDIRFYGSFVSIGTRENLELGRESWNDKVRSLQVRPWKADFESSRLPEIEIFSQPNLEGESKRLGAVNENLGDWNDKIRSLRCMSLKCSVFVFEDSEFSSLSVFLQTEAQTLEKDLDGQISSLVALPVNVEDVCVIVYSEENHSGAEKEFCGDSATLHNFNDRIKSLKLKCIDCGVILYEHTWFRGKFKGFSTISVLSDEWTGIVSSIQVRPWQLNDYEGVRMPEIEAFTGPNLDGESKTFTAMVEYVGDDFNDKISSFNCLHAWDCVVIAFEDSSMGGFSRMFDGSITDIQLINDKISSMLALPQSSSDFCVTVYKDSNYRGDSIDFCGDVRNVGRDWNDEITSLKLSCDQCSVILYTGTSFQGRFKAFNSSGNVGEDFNDKVTSLQVRPYKLPAEYEGSRGEDSDDNCVNKDEEKAHNVIQWIPFIGTIYEIGSAIGYAAAGCDEVAKERAIGAGIGLLTDAAVAVTGGTAGVFVYGAKTGAKLGVKAGIKAVGTAIKASVQSAVKGVLIFSKQGLKQMVATSTKAVLKDAQGVVQGLKGLIQGSIKGTGKGLRHLSKHGFKKSLKDLNQKLAQVGARQIDEIAAGVQKKIDEAQGVSGAIKAPNAPGLDARPETGAGPRQEHHSSPNRPNSDNTSPRQNGQSPSNGFPNHEIDEFLNPHSNIRCKRTITSVCNRLQNVARRRMDENTVSTRRELFERLNTRTDQTTEVTFRGETMTAKVYKTSGEVRLLDGSNKRVTNKLILENLQNYNDFVPKSSGFKTVGGKRQRTSYRPPLQVDMPIGGVDRKFTLISSSEVRFPKTQRQIFVHTENADYPNTSPVVSYKKAVANMQATPTLFLGAEDLKRLHRKRAELLLDSIETHWEDNIHWDSVYLKDEAGDIILANGQPVKVMGPEQVRSGVELIAITQIAEAAPPERSFFQTLITSTKQKLGIPPNGRTPGMDKLARQAFREIKDGRLTFDQVFGSNGVFVAAQNKGTEAGRRLMRGLLEDSPYADLVEVMSASTRESLPSGG